MLLELVTTSKDRMRASYPELETGFERIAQIVTAEEEAFRRTLAAGTTILDVAVRETRQAGGTVLGGAEAFQLHDTYGFPIDLTLEMAAEQGLSVDEEGFRRLMTEQRERAKADAGRRRPGTATPAGTGPPTAGSRRSSLARQVVSRPGWSGCSSVKPVGGSRTGRRGRPGSHSSTPRPAVSWPTAGGS